jgi:hypothetical protein
MSVSLVSPHVATSKDCWCGHAWTTHRVVWQVRVRVTQVWNACQAHVSYGVRPLSAREHG